MSKRKSKNAADDKLIQQAITKFFDIHKGPLKFDSKPLRSTSNENVKRTSRKRSKGKKGALAQDDDDSNEVVSDENELSSERTFKANTTRGGKSRKTTRQKKAKPLPADTDDDDDDDVIIIGEYTLSDERQVSVEASKENNNTDENDETDKENDDVRHLSPNIIFHGDRGDVVFTSKSVNSNPNKSYKVTGMSSDNNSNNNNEDDYCGPSPPKTKKLSPVEDDSDVPSFSQDVSARFAPLTPMKVTRSEKQSTELRKRSRILQRDSNVLTPEFISTDFLQEDDLHSTNSSGTTLVQDQETAVHENLQSRQTVNGTKIFCASTVNYIREIQLFRNVNVNETVTNAVSIDAALQADEYSENRRKYHLSLIDVIVDNARKGNLNNLLLEKERKMLREFVTLPNNYKFLCSKLFTYMSKWHNLHKFVEKIKLTMNNAEILTMCNYLMARNVISSDISSETSVHLLDLLQVNDVKDIHNSLKLKSKKTTKPVLIKSIIEHANQQTTLTTAKSMDKVVREKIYQKLGLRVRLTDSFHDMFTKIHLLYSFTNPEFAQPSDLYLFIARVRNGEVRMPAVTLEETSIFKDAEEFARFSKACAFKNELLLEFDRKKKSENVQELCKAIYGEFKKLLEDKSCIQDREDGRPYYLKRFSAGNKYASALSFACKQMTTECPGAVKDWLELLLSQETFCQLKRGFWYSQLSMVHHRYFKDPEKAAEILVTSLKDKNLSVIDLSELTYKGEGYCRKKTSKTTRSVIEELSSLLINCPAASDFPSITVDAVSNHSNEAGARSQYRTVNLNGDVEILSVEQVAINHYIDEKGFAKGMHCEGALMTTIFCVLFWDILYSPTVSKLVPFAFISELQYLPLDFSTREFYSNRQIEIEDRLSNIRSEWSLNYLEDYVDIIWQSLSHTKSLIVPHIVVDSTELNNIILCIDRNVVSEICRRLAEHFREHRAGMPDLFLWNVAAKRCKFVEVKGPGDKLSTKQKLWLQFLRSVGADIEVCHVHAVGGKRSQKYKSRPKK